MLSIAKSTTFNLGNAIIKIFVVVSPPLLLENKIEKRILLNIISYY